ncbi:MAG TPA: hypothetical protein VHM70_09085 [Polyangiaceae bacterium]|jgi:hypothetical protein|nr:hypothetical protein [Polyangiaceae bacterium]
MDTVRLIDAIVRHTTAFIAQLSTSAGLRAPLAHIADQVFLDLSREIEAQGVSRKVVASMFGMALRGYQRKVQRLTESSSHKGKTLWEALVEHLHTHGPTLRSELERRFDADGEEHVAAVLRDLTDSGVVYSTGRGGTAIYGLSSDQDRERILMQTRGEKLELATWYAIHRKPQSFGSLCAALGGRSEELLPIVEELIRGGWVHANTEGLTETTELSSQRFLVPVGDERGFEVAVFDHYRALLDAVATKLRLRSEDPEAAKWVGGTTLVFDLHPSHPLSMDVLGSLERVRGDLGELWERVSRHNRENPFDREQLTQVTFYFGQNVETPSKDQH